VPAAPIDPLLTLLERQRQMFGDSLPVPANVRRDRLRRTAALLYAHRAAFCAAMDADFGGRPAELSLMTDVVIAIKALDHAARHLDRWMRPERRALPFPLGWVGGRATVERQPKGVIGVIAPWNFPVNLAFAPLAGIFAAGNHVMLKPSESTPATSALMQELVAKEFDPGEFTVVTGDAGVAAAFSRLPFDHLLFTGGASVGRHVMRAAAENLVPVTLELGGKCPVILGRSADLAHAARCIAHHKLVNAGQMCLAPDYVIAPAATLETLAEALRASVAAMYPRIAGNPEYTAIVDARHHARVMGYVREARERGATVVEINPAGDAAERLAAERRVPLTLLRGVDDSLRVMQEEIFGPVLPLVPLESVGAAIDYVNARPRPLALYYFGKDRAEERELLDRTITGSVGINEITYQFGVDDLPFGGVGASGLGAYHGVDGYREFSHARAIYRHGWVDTSALGGMRPPYGERLQKTLARELRPWRR
jgi:coniferyl-aldehyde dehydrogenase